MIDLLEVTATPGRGLSRSHRTGGAGVSLSYPQNLLHKQQRTEVDQTPEIVKTLVKRYPNKVKIYEFFKPIEVPKTEDKPEKSLNEKHAPKRYASNPEEIEKNRQKSISRTRNTMIDIADCNDFKYFATFTFDPKKTDVFDWDYCEKVFRKWLNNQKRLHGNFEYLAVREPQKTGAIHFHALLGNFTGKLVPNTRIKNKAKVGKVYEVVSWRKTSGFADAELIHDKTKLANYITKYISKDFELLDSGKQRFFASNGLKRPIKTYNDEPTAVFVENFTNTENMNVYENEHCQITTYDKLDLKAVKSPAGSGILPPND